MVNRKMWGLTLLERNIRELHRLGFNRIYIATITHLNPLTHLCHPLPDSLEISQEVIAADAPYAQLCTLLKEKESPVLLIDGHALNDRRILRELLATPQSRAAISPVGKNPGAAACLSQASLKGLHQQKGGNLTQFIEQAIASGSISQLDDTNFNPYIENLRREIQPYFIKVENEEQFQEAESILKQTVHKGVNDFVAKYIHPPFEFGIVRLIGQTRISPNQITGFWLILAGLAIPLFMYGYIFAGLILAAVSGILDGVDGKLARLTLRFSKAGDLLDHVGNTIYDALWYLSLGWYFSAGNPHSTGALFTYMLVISYVLHRIVPGLFRLMHRHEIYNYGQIDKFVRLIGARMNNNIWLMLTGVVLGYTKEAYMLVCIWMAVTALWYVLRFLWVTFSSKSVFKKSTARVIL